MLTASQSSCVLHWLRAFYIICDDETGNNIFAKLIQASKSGKEFFPFTSGENKCDFIEIHKLAQLIVQISLQTEIRGITNVCTGEPESLGKCVERFIQDHGLTIKLSYGAYPDRLYDSPGVWGDTTKIQHLLK